MLKQYAFFYLMKNDPDIIQETIPAHIDYWQNNKPKNYSGGPFGDKSGGLILFDAENMEAAEVLVMNDPFIVREAIETRWIKEWLKE